MSIKKREASYTRKIKRTIACYVIATFPDQHQDTATMNLEFVQALFYCHTLTSYKLSETLATGWPTYRSLKSCSLSASSGFNHTSVNAKNMNPNDDALSEVITCGKRGQRKIAIATDSIDIFTVSFIRARKSERY